MAQQELKAIANFYELMPLLIRYAEKFPRRHRCGLGLATESRLQMIWARRAAGG